MIKNKKQNVVYKSKATEKVKRRPCVTLHEAAAVKVITEDRKKIKYLFTRMNELPPSLPWNRNKPTAHKKFINLTKPPHTATFSFAIHRYICQRDVSLLLSYPEM